MADLYIGLISGTSMDGIDAALVAVGERSAEVIETREQPYPASLRDALYGARTAPQECTVDQVGKLHRWVGEAFRDAALGLMSDAGVAAADVTAIGSHGQTLRHSPVGEHPFTLQLGDPSVIAKGTGITTVADFRSADIALGGQGAPLVPAFHEWLFTRDRLPRVVVNIGGIANITVLSGSGTATTGFDTGPGNTLLDAWMLSKRRQAFDSGGSWAASGSVNATLLSRLLADGYFRKLPPKSTGFEYFNLAWLGSFDVDDLPQADVQATLCALTAESIAADIRRTAAPGCDVLVCGGGAHNSDLLRRLREALPDRKVGTTLEAGIDPDWVEAAAFAWLAMRRLHGLTGNIPAVTGASRATVLGAVYAAG